MVPPHSKYVLTHHHQRRRRRRVPMVGWWGTRWGSERAEVGSSLWWAVSSGQCNMHWWRINLSCALVIVQIY